MTPPVPADDVRVLLEAREDFFRRHRKGQQRAKEAWASLAAKRGSLLANVGFGALLSGGRLPTFLQGRWPLRVIKGLPHGFRAVYSVFNSETEGLVVQIEWIGDHKEYDDLFGYSTS